MDEQLLYERYLLSAYRFLNYRLRSEKEVRDNLLKKKASPEVIEKIISKLKEQRFLNDETFARMWVESRSRTKPRSHYLLKLELRQKGINDEIIEKILNNEQRAKSKDEIFFSEKEIPSDIELAKSLVEKKIKKYKGLQRQEIYQKLGGVLGRKGFSWCIIKRCIDDALDEEV
ncbi:MAG TPA: RecX family transcriptional regulator [Patescibacteria group bacterium]|nr:RecX family transcriptional regulator [Patescibacteria group bacterium]